VKILVCPAGSHGDVLPLIGVGKELQHRGHQVHVISNASFEPLVREAGLAFTASSTAEAMTALLNDSGVTDSMTGLALIAEGVMASIGPSHEVLLREMEPGRTIVVGSSFALATRLLSETHHVPSVTLHLSPSWFRSDHVAPSLGPLGHLAWAPRFIKRGLWKAADRRFLDPLFTEPFNRIRAGMGLAPVQRMLHEWIHQADLTLGMFPEWFAPRQPDWPRHLVLTGFPLYDHGNAGDTLPADVEAFLAAGDPPVAFTAGTANATSHAFYAASAQACGLSGRRGILLTQDARQLPATLPAGVAHFSYVPFKALLPRLAAFVHHGGIGSTSQGLLAGVPQLIRPMAYDQFDNASRAVSLGVASQLLPRRYRPQTAARALDRLVADRQVQRRCHQVAGQTRGCDGIHAACDAILRLNPGG